MSLLSQLSQDAFLGICNEQLFFFLYRNRRSIYTTCTCILKLIVHFSTIAIVLGLVNYTFARLPLPFPHSVRPELLAYLLGAVAIILVLNDVLCLLLKGPETKPHGSIATLLGDEQKNLRHERTSSQIATASILVERHHPHNVADKLIGDTFADEEEEIAICESLIIAINESPGTSVVDDWEIIEISSDEEDEVVEIIADVGSWRNAEDTAQQWRKEAQSMIAEGNKLEQRATRAFNNANGRKGRELLDKRAELNMRAAEYHRKAAEHLFNFHNPTYGDNKAGLTRLDLHGLHPEEAKERIIEHLSMCRRRNIKQTRIITGKGIHSWSGKSVLRPMTMKLLELEADLAYMLQPGNSGMVLVDFAREPPRARL